MSPDMRYLPEFFVIAAFYYAGELLHTLVPLPVPAAVYGMLLLFAALASGVVKPGQVEHAADFLLENMAVLFIPPAVGIVTMAGVLADSWWKIVLICVLTTFAAIAVTGHTAQLLGKLRDRKKGE